MTSYVGLVFGRNMFGRGSLSWDEVSSRLSGLPAGTELVGISGNSGNVVIRATEVFDEDSLRAELERLLPCPCVAACAGGLRSILEEALAELRPKIGHSRGAYRVATADGVWEPGLVIAAEAMPVNLTASDIVLSADGPVRAVKMIRARALLVMKRGVPWGDRLVKPLAEAIKRSGAATRCLTSRSLGSVERVLQMAEAGFVGGRN